MALDLKSPSAQIAGYLLLTASLYRASSPDAGPLLMAARLEVSTEMTLETLCDAINLLDVLVYPRVA